jgi:hypothetical protein
VALTAKQEAFCRAVALEGLDQTAAYSKAYDVSKMKQESVHKAASNLANDPKVSTRIAVLTERATAAAVKKAGYTLADAMAEAEEVLDDAKALGQIGPAVSAVKLRAQLAGHLVEKKEVSTKTSLEETDVDSLLKIKAQVDAQLDRAREALGMTGGAVSNTPPARRVIGA